MFLIVFKNNRVSLVLVFPSSQSLLLSPDTRDIVHPGKFATKE